MADYTEKDILIIEPGSKYVTKVKPYKIINRISKTFPELKSVKKLVIGSDIVEINNESFMDCKELREVEFQYGMEKIGIKAFYNCKKLNRLVIPNSVKEICYEAFSGCSSLTSLVIPDSVQQIGWKAFKGCSSLMAVVISNSITTIRDATFQGCSGLTGVIIPNGVTGILKAAFKGCTRLISVTIPDTVTKIDIEAFNDCDSLKSVIIPESLTTIEQFAFWGCHGLSNIIISTSIQRIHPHAFDYCIHLANIYVPDSIAKHNIFAFKNGIIQKQSILSTEQLKLTKALAFVLDGMIADKAATNEVAMLLAKVQSLGKPYLALLVSMCKNSMELLDIERARQWPAEHASALSEFVLQMPYAPLPDSYPCGRKELFITEALQDTSVPMAVRVHLWRTLVMDGYTFPHFDQNCKWTMPQALYDLPAAREWIFLTKQKGWKAFSYSDPLFFGSDINEKFTTEEERKALAVIEQDFTAGLLMPLDIEGKELPSNYALAALMKKAVDTVIYLFANNKTFNKLISAQKLLFYACANWDADKTLSLVTSMEQEKPGVVKNCVDDYWHDALWYTLYRRGRFDPVSKNEHLANDVLLTQKLIEFGCDPKRQNYVGLCYEDIAWTE